MKAGHRREFAKAKTSKRPAAPVFLTDTHSESAQNIKALHCDTQTQSAQNVKAQHCDAGLDSVPHWCSSLTLTHTESAQNIKVVHCDAGLDK